MMSACAAAPSPRASASSSDRRPHKAFPGPRNRLVAGPFRLPLLEEWRATQVLPTARIVTAVVLAIKSATGHSHGLFAVYSPGEPVHPHSIVNSSKEVIQCLIRSRRFRRVLELPPVRSSLWSERCVLPQCGARFERTAKSGRAVRTGRSLLFCAACPLLLLSISGWLTIRPPINKLRQMPSCRSEA